MKKSLSILFDTNILLDVLINRKPFVVPSAKLVSLVESNIIEGYLCATTLTTIDYLIAKAHNRQRAKIEIQKLIDLFKIADVNKKVLSLYLQSKFNDFEDAVQYFSAECVSVDGLVTRNTKDYRETKLPIYTPDELLSIIELSR